MPADPVIEVRDLRKTYRSGLIFRRSLEALNGVTFRVENTRKLKPGYEKHLL